MHQSTQRRFCRAVFLAGCILPTLAVMAWATYEQLPSTMASRLVAIEQVLAVRMKARVVFTPKPGTFRAEGIEVANMETGEIILCARSASYELSESGSLVRLVGVELAEGELAHLAGKLHDVLEVDWPESVRVEATDVRWRGEASPTASAFVAGQRITMMLESKGTGNSITGRHLTLQLGTDGPQLVVDRNRQVSPPATSLRLDTVGQNIPAEWIIALGAVVVDGGEEATFAGKLNLYRTVEGTHGTATGSLQQLNLTEATGFPIAVTGSIRNLELQWRDDRVELARGELEAGAGQMPGLLALELQELFGNVPQAGSQLQASDVLSFGALHVAFQLDGASLTLVPSPSTGIDACVLGSDGQTLFGRPSHCAPIPYLATVMESFGSDSARDRAASLPRGVKR